MDFLWLLFFTTLLLACLTAAALRRPTHGVWDRVDVLYYSLAIVGVLLFFLTESYERSSAQALDARNDHAARLEQLKRYQPAFAPPYPGDPSISEGAYDLLEIQDLAATCGIEGPEGERCAAAKDFSPYIGAAFGDLKEPPILPGVHQATAYAKQFCDGVQRLGSRAPDVIDPILKQPLRNGLERLAKGSPRDPHSLTQMRMAISSARGQNTPQVDFAITVLNAASACPADLPIDGQLTAQADSWGRQVERHERLLRAAEQRLQQLRSRGSDPPNFGDTTLLAFAMGLWPFFVSAALCLKLARAIRDLRTQRAQTGACGMQVAPRD